MNHGNLVDGARRTGPFPIPALCFIENCILMLSSYTIIA